MRGFLSSLLAVVIILLLSQLYVAWVDTSSINRSFRSYTVMIRDVYKRAQAEDEIYDVLKRNVLLCKTLLTAGGDVEECALLVNRSFLDVLSKYNIVPSCPIPVAVVVYPASVSLIVTCPIEGNIGSALFRLPRGAEVRA
jgi:hypothetical protein